MYKPNLENEQEQLNLNSFTSKFEHVDTVNLNLGNLKFSLRRLRKQLLVATGVLLVGGITYFSIPEKKTKPDDLYKKYFDDFSKDSQNRKTIIEYKDLSAYYKAMSCIENGNEELAIPIFEELIESGIIFKDKCMWYLVRCYIATNAGDEKVINLLTELSEMKSEYSLPALEIIEAKKNNQK